MTDRLITAILCVFVGLNVASALHPLNDFAWFSWGVAASLSLITLVTAPRD